MNFLELHLAAMSMLRRFFVIPLFGRIYDMKTKK